MCPSDIIQATESNQTTSAFVQWKYQDISYDVIRISCDPEWGSEFFEGLTNVTCQAFDEQDNTADCRFSVEVVVCKLVLLILIKGYGIILCHL